MNDVEKEALQNMSIWSMCCNILATTFKVMMVCTRLGKHVDVEEDTDHPVDVKHDVILVEQMRSGSVLMLEEVVLPLVHHVPMPQNK